MTIEDYGGGMESFALGEPPTLIRNLHLNRLSFFCMESFSPFFCNFPFFSFKAS